MQYAAATSAIWTVTPLSGNLAVGQYLLIAEGNSGNTAGAPLPTPDQVGNTDLNLTSGKVALVSSFTPLNVACPSGPQVLDLVGYGTLANCFEGSGRAPNGSNTVGVIRKAAGCTDANDNSADFLAVAPTPRNSATTKNPCAPIPAAPTPTGSSPTSPGNSTTPKIIGTAPTGSSVELYTNAACAGAAAAAGSAAQFAAPGITVTVAAESTTSFYALAFDANNTSACSAGAVTYVEDSGVPTPPTLQASNPSSPSSSTTPKLLGAAEAGTTVRIYGDAACTKIAAVGTAAQFISPGIATTVSPDSTTSFYATATDAAGNVSPCSTGSLTYVNDSTPPAAPILSSSTPPSPSSVLSPKLLGTAEPGSTVRIYTDATCTNLAGSGTAAQFGSSGIAATVAANSVSIFRATATDAVGNTSPCSASSLTYVNDSAAPAEPGFGSSNPASPSTSTTPRLIGTAEAGSTVRIYSDAACTELSATGSAAQFASPGIAVTVPADSTTSFHATSADAVGNTSGCSSSSLTYVNDSDAPAQPTFSSSTPASPANGTSPKLLGTAEPGSTVRIYSDAACTNLAATGTAAQFAAPGIAVTVPPNSTTTFHATATDAVGNASACSSSLLTYVEDSTAPAQPTFASSIPASPANSTEPKLLGTAEPGSTVRIYTDATCTELSATGTAAQFAAGIAVAVPAGSSTTFHATAADAVGNTSGCSSSSLTYVNDSDAPAQPTFSSSTPASPANGTSPKLLGTAEPGSTVRIYSDAACTNLLATGTAAQFTAPGIAVTVPPNSTTTFHATATDGVGNTSACSGSSLTYVEDSAPPAQPTFAASTPPSPSSNPAPSLLGSAEAGSTVRIYTDAACTNLTATGTAAQFGAAGIGVTVPATSTTGFHATATDAVGNTSACSSSSLTYTADPAVPDPPRFSSSTPGSPATSTSPRLLGVAEPGSTVRIYTDSLCTELVAVGTAAQFGTPGITVTVAVGSSTTFHATVRNAAESTSACSPDSLTYVQDSSAPAEPSFTSSNPPSPAGDLTPNLLGVAEAGSTVRIYSDSACTEPAASGSAAQFAAPGLGVVVAAGSTTSFHATATDPAGNVSPCSTGSLTYVQRATPALPPPPNQPLPPVEPDPVRLRISHLRVTPSSFLAGERATPVASIAADPGAVGAQIRFTLSRSARVGFTILRAPRRRQLPGRLGSPAHVLRRLLGSGPGVIPFSGRLGNRIFPPGRYRLYAVAIDRAGDKSNLASALFRIRER